MSETRDPAIKLFGKTITVPTTQLQQQEEGEQTTLSLEDRQLEVKDDYCNDDDDDDDLDLEEKDMSNKRKDNKEKDQAPQIEEDSSERDAASGINENSPKTPSIDKEITTSKVSKAEKDQSETCITKEKTKKKPDKILPCPRCNSLDTKFCYYNNYNVNQPRHFCKNCQRYWTAGGTMRNVPVGAGRRKNKNFASHYRHVTVSEAPLRTETSESIHNPTLKPNGNVLSFGLDVPLCESMTSILNLAEKKMQNFHRDGFHRTGEVRFPVQRGSKNGEEHSSGSSVTPSTSVEEGQRSNLQEPAIHNCHVFPPRMPYCPGAPWNYPWNSAQWGSPAPPPAPPTLLPPLPPPPAFCASSFPMSFYPAAPYWGCPMPGTWSIHWSSPLSSSPNTVSSGSGSNSITLGKHSREVNTCDAEKGDTSKQSNSERSVWIPKTLRIDDPDEAAKSSIWATLGIKNDKAGGIKGGGLFKAFHSKTDEKNRTVDNSQVLHANPAALSRSLNFHESL